MQVCIRCNIQHFSLSSVSLWQVLERYLRLRQRINAEERRIFQHSSSSSLYTYIPLDLAEMMGLSQCWTAHTSFIMANNNSSPLPGFTQCQDGHRCFYGSLCTRNPFDEGAFYCDCDESTFDDAVSGLSCEHVATDYCTFGKEVSMTSFCTNHGTCKAQVGVNDAHLGCDCPAGYVGDHCQFIEGTTIPNNWPGGESVPNWGYNASSESISGGVKAVIVLICLGLVGALGYFVYKKKKSSSGSSSGISSPEFALEADGEVLQRAVQTGVHNNGNGTAEFELDADGGVLRDAIESKSPPSPATTASMEDINVVSPSSQGEEDDGDDDDDDDDREENGGGGIV